MKITYLALCSCGAYSFQMDNNKHAIYSIHNEHVILLPREIALDIMYYDKKQIAEYSSCNHCVNNWGLDLCACGSGEPYNTCEERLDNCDLPMQSIEEGHDHINAKDAWGVK